MPLLILLFLIQCTSGCFAVIVQNETKFVKEFPFLMVEPISTRDYGLYAIKRVQETLNLTCTVFDNSTNMEHRYNITWSVPTSSRNSKNHVVIQSFGNSANLVVSNLDYRDEGEYACIAQPVNQDLDFLSKNVTVNIKHRRKWCGETMFTCSLSKLQNCIIRRYKCDGYEDCEMGEDEDPEMCGDSPCSNKLNCKDPRTKIIRCIPKSWCCNIRLDANCTTKEPLSCCPLQLYKTYYLEGRRYFEGHQPYHPDMNLLQATIYTVIGCAMVFMIVVTVLVIAICRVHMKRRFVTQCPVNVVQPPQNVPLQDLDVVINRGSILDRGFLITYNINNGVQIVGHAVDPPPYCEVISVPPREGPPPPYTSHETLDQPETEALLQQPAIVRRNRTNDEHLRRITSDPGRLDTTLQAIPRPSVINNDDLVS